MKAEGNTGAPAADKDPDFNDPLPGMHDPDESEFRDQVLVSNYQHVGALKTELENERLAAEQATLDVLEAMASMDAGDQVKWRISRSGHDNDELNGYLETWPNHQMSIERLRDRFGGGTYYCKGFRKGKYFSHQTLQISGEAKRKPSGVEGVTQSVPVAAGTPAFDVQSFLMAQDRRDEKRREQERQDRIEREDREEKRRAERMQMVLALGPAAITALGGLFQGRQQDLAPLIAALKPPDPLTMMTQLKALQGNGQDGLLKQLLPMFMDMATSRAGSGDTGWLDVIKEFAKGAGPAVGGLIEANLRAAQTQSASAPAGPALPAPAASGVAPTPAPVIVVEESVPRRERRSRSAASNVRESAEQSKASSSTSETQEMNIVSLMPYIPWLRSQLEVMLRAAQRNRDVEVYAALIMEELPEGLTPAMVGELLSRQDWFATVCQLEPRWNNATLYPWIEVARTLILQSLQPVSAPPPPPATSPPTANPRPAPRGGGEVVDRPTKLPSLTGD